MNDEQGTTPEASRITITFDADQNVELRYDGRISPYMLLGAAGVLAAQGNIGIANANPSPDRSGIVPVRSVPTDIRRR